MFDNTIANISAISVGQGYKPAFIPESWFVGIVRLAAYFQIPLALWVQLGQLAGLFILFHRRIAVFLIFDYILLHTGIFFLSGIFFWKWIIVDLALAAFLLKLPAEVAERAFIFPLRKHFSNVSVSVIALASLALIICSHSLFYPVGLAWFDSRASFSYNFFGVGETGKRYQIARNFFQPFDVYFAQNRFYYLDPPEDRFYIGVYGGGSYARAMTINSLTSLSEFEHLLERDGKSMNDETARKGLKGFLVAYFSHYNAKREEFSPVKLIIRPNHILTETRRGVKYMGQEDIVRVEVDREIVFFNGREIEYSPPKRVLAVDIP